MQQLREEGHVVMMVGDGVNDAPALFEAHVGVSLGKSDLASESANVVLVRQDALGQLHELMRLGRVDMGTLRLLRYQFAHLDKARAGTLSKKEALEWRTAV